MDLTQENKSNGFIIREREPVNMECPVDQLESFLTPTKSFYVRNHFKIPTIDASNHVLKIGGDVQSPFAISVSDLRNLPNETMIATLECAGNGRVFLTPAVEGAQWELGAVGTAEWTGVRLSHFLERARTKPGVCELVLEGADTGEPKISPAPPGKISYSRSIQVAMQNEVLIAYQMNGEALTPAHGYPLRAIVPTHYGIASVKWLTNIFAVSKPFMGYWQTTDYSYWDVDNGLPVQRPLGEMALKSCIFNPKTLESIKALSKYEVLGAAWGGKGGIQKVEVSLDEGATWNTADLLDDPQKGVWQRWRFTWSVLPQVGKVRILSRAHDTLGNIQPSQHQEKYGTYVINHSVPIEVSIVGL